MSPFTCTKFKDVREAIDYISKLDYKHLINIALENYDEYSSLSSFTSILANEIDMANYKLVEFYKAILIKCL